MCDECLDCCMPTQFSFEEVASPNQMSNAAGTVFSTVAGILRFCKPMDRIRFVLNTSSFLLDVSSHVQIICIAWQLGERTLLEMTFVRICFNKRSVQFPDVFVLVHHRLKKLRPLYLIITTTSPRCRRGHWWKQKVNPVSLKILR